MSYKVIVTREGGNWLADVPDVPGAHTWARSIPSLMKNVREVIALMDDLPDNARVNTTVQFKVDTDPTLEKNLNRALAVSKERDKILKQQLAAQKDLVNALSALRGAGLSVRDAGAVLGVTPGRVSQLLPTREVRKPRQSGSRRAGSKVR